VIGNDTTVAALEPVTKDRDASVAAAAKRAIARLQLAR
jgi:hypothetical protein